MNKNFFLVIGLLLFGSALRSQSHMGIKAGLTLSNQDKSISIPQLPTIALNTKSLVGYQLGVFYKTRLNKQFSLSAETNLSVIGSGTTLVATDGESYDTNEKLGYIELPLTLQYAVNKLYVGVGPSVGFKLFSKLTGFEDRNFDIPYYQTVDAAGNILAGYTVVSRVDVNIRYSHGLLNTYKNEGYAEAKNRFFNLSVLYALK